MIRSLSIASLAFTSSLIAGAFLASPISAGTAAVQQGQWPLVEAGAAGPTRKAPDAPKPGKLVPVNDTTQYPYTAVGLFSNGCSGTLIGKRFVLTAAFCIFNPKTKQWDQNLDFYPGINGQNQPFGGVKWKNSWVTKGFAEQGNWDLAFGLVELGSNVGDQNGWFGFGHVPQFPKGPVMTGYAGGVPDFTMWETICPVKAADPSFVTYNCPLNKPHEGMAGAAIWIIDKPSNAPMLIAIHGGPRKGNFWGQRINEETFHQLQAWMKDAEDTSGTVPGDDTQAPKKKP